MNPYQQQAIGYYNGKLRQFGPDARGMDWNSTESQELRFEVLLQAVGALKSASLLDYGCGTGAMLDYVIRNRPTLELDYTGFDLSTEMIEAARSLHPGNENRFVPEPGSLSPSYDVVVASGVFNVRNSFRESEWEQYCLEEIARLHALSKKAFAFNILTSYSDEDKKRDHLFYADPARFFDYCKRNFSRNVALLHDYGLYEFTLIIRK